MTCVHCFQEDVQRRLDDAKIDELLSEIQALGGHLSERSEQLAASQKALATSSDELTHQKIDNSGLQAELQQEKEQLAATEEQLSEAKEGWTGTKHSLSDTQKQVTTLQESFGAEKDRFRVLHNRFDQEQIQHQESQVCLSCAARSFRTHRLQ